MGALDPAKLLVIFVVALLVLGPERLPKAAREVAGVWRELVKLRDQVTEEVRSALPADVPRIPTPRPGSIAGFINSLTTEKSSQAVPTRVRPSTGATDEPSSSRAPGKRARAVHAGASDEIALIANDPSMN